MALTGSPHIQIKLFGLIANLDTLVAVWSVMIFICVIAFLASMNLKKQYISYMQFVFEGIHDLWEEQIKSQIKWKPDVFIPLISSLFCFIILSHWFGLLPWKILLLWENLPKLDNGVHWEGASPCTDVNINAGIALLSVLTYLISGIIAGKFAYIAPYLALEYHHKKVKANPTGLIEWLDLILRPFTLTLRLFANTFSGEVLLATIVKIAPFAIPILILFFELGVGVLQAFIFSMLTTVYLSIALSHAHE